MNMSLKPVDALILVYVLLVSALIAVFHTRVPLWPFYLPAAALYVAVVLSLIGMEARYGSRRWYPWLRSAYPWLSIPLLFESISGYVQMIHGCWLDPEVIAWETRLFGGSPNLLLDKIVSKPLTEFFMLVYFSYYIYIFIPPVLFFARRRLQDLDRFVLGLVLAFIFCSLGFVLLPLQGPIFALVHEFRLPRLAGYFFTPLQGWLMSWGDPAGTCFPSSHVAVAWTCLLNFRRIFGRRVFWLIFPFTVCLTIAVVYNRYHYAVDALAGLVVAAVSYSLTEFFLRGHNGTPEKSNTSL
jgi:hypothetical protein